MNESATLISPAAYTWIYLFPKVPFILYFCILQEMVCHLHNSEGNTTTDNMNQSKGKIKRKTYILLNVSKCLPFLTYLHFVFTA